MYNRYLHCTKGTSDKVYSLHVRETDKGRFAVIGFWGSAKQAKNGTLQVRGAVRIHLSAGSALFDADAFAAKKLSDGYRDVYGTLIWRRGLDPLIATSIVSDDAIVALIPNATQVSAPRTKLCPMCQNVAIPLLATACIACVRPPWIATKSSPPPPPPWTCDRCGLTFSPGSRPGRPGGNGRGPMCGNCVADTEPRPQVSLPPIPTWVTACFAEIPPRSRPQAARILATSFPGLAPVIERAAEESAPAPTTTPKDVMYCVVGSRQGSKVHVPGIGFMVNGKLDAEAARILEAGGTPVVPHVWDNTPFADPALRPYGQKPTHQPAQPAPVAGAPVDWIRAVFALTPLNARHDLWRSFTKIVHEDVSKDPGLHLRWNDAYARFAPPPR